MSEKCKHGIRDTETNLPYCRRCDREAASELAAPAGSALVSYIQRQEEWSAKTFGNGVRTKGITAHIRKELLEIEATPHDVEEWIDVVILALDGAWRAGYSPEQIVAALEAKQAKNFKRTYPMPLSDDHPSEHLREAPNIGLGNTPADSKSTNPLL